MIENIRKVGDDYFGLVKLNDINRGIELEKHLEKFDPNDYYILKSSRFQKLVSFEEFKDFKYCRYVFFRKDKYNVNDILKWIEWMKDFGGIQFLHKPVPPFDPYEKIKIKE